MFESIRLRPAALVVSAILLALTFFLGRRPYYNWDMFPYMAVIMERPGAPFDSVHREVYQAAADYLPPQDFEAISARQPELAKDPSAFKTILKYFTIKPGYTMLAGLSYRMGVHPVLATCLPSLIGYLAVGMGLFFWAQSVDRPASALLFTLLVSLSPPMIDLARHSSPDMMCTALSVASVALILTARPAAGLSLLYMSIWVRPDAILLFIPLSIALTLSKSIRWGLAAILIVSAMATAWMILEGLDLVWEYVEVNPSVGRWDSYLIGFQSPSPYLLLVLVMGAALVYLAKRVLLPSRTLMVLAGMSALVARYLLHPVIEDRFNLPVYFLILMIGWETIMNWRKRLALAKS